MEQQPTDKFTFLFMKQVPKKTADDFVKLANEEFSGHFGFCLKAMMDGAIAFRNEIDATRLEELETRIKALESKENVSAVKRTVGGRVIQNG